jgi:CheY-like chemotaxis protein
MSEGQAERILIVDTNPVFREQLAQELRATGYNVITAESGELALLILRDWQQPIGWFYSRAPLPGLIDGWILADEYHDSQPNRAAVLSAPSSCSSADGDIILENPSTVAVLAAIRQVISTEDRL